MILRLAVLLLLGFTFFAVWSVAVILILPEWLSRPLFMLPLDILFLVGFLYVHERYFRLDYLISARFFALWLETGKR